MILYLCVPPIDWRPVQGVFPVLTLCELAPADLSYNMSEWDNGWMDTEDETQGIQKEIQAMGFKIM